MTSLMTDSDEQCIDSPLSADDDVWRSDDDDDDDDARLRSDWDNTAASLWRSVICLSSVCSASADDDNDAMWRSRLEISVRLLSMATSCCCCWNKWRHRQTFTHHGWNTDKIQIMSQKISKRRKKLFSMRTHENPRACVKCDSLHIRVFCLKS